MKPLTYEQVMAVCKKFVDDGIHAWDAHGQRYQRGGACMLMHGYRYGHHYPD